MRPEALGLNHYLELLRKNEEELRRKGVVRAAIFGSIARGENTEHSDVDVMVDLDPERRMGIYGFVGIGCFLEDVFHRRVDVVERKRLRQKLGEAVETEAIFAF
jgi:hypothetical protein